MAMMNTFVDFISVEINTLYKLKKENRKKTRIVCILRCSKINERLSILSLVLKKYCHTYWSNHWYIYIKKLYNTYNINGKGKYNETKIINCLALSVQRYSP